MGVRVLRSRWYVHRGLAYGEEDGTGQIDYVPEWHA